MNTTAFWRDTSKRTDFKPTADEHDIEAFLAQIVRPSPFVTVALIIPDMPDAEFPIISTWISKLMQRSLRACYWDQAQSLPPSSYPRTQITLKYPVPVRFESGLTPLTILPHQPDFADFSDKSELLKMDFLRHLIRSLKTCSEVWVGVKASEIKKYYALLQATDAVCVMVPQHKDALLKCYEAIKSVHLSGYFSPIGLLDFCSENEIPKDFASQQIKNVAKQFLAIDLVPSGVVLSNSDYIPPQNEATLRSRMTSTEKTSQDFLYCLCEASLYQFPGLFQQ